MDPALLMDFLGLSTGELERLALIMTRLSGIFLAAPFFSRAMGPFHIRVALVAVLTLVMFPLASPWRGEGSGDALLMFMATVQELLLGVVMGMFIHWALMAVQVAGAVMGFEMGLSLAEVMDPTSGLQEGVVSSLLYFAALLVFLALDGHHLILEGLARSFRSVPPGGGIPPPGAVLEAAVEGVVRMFAVGVLLAAPVIAASKLLYLGLGLINRAAPQIQVFFVAMPAVQMVGMLVLGLTMAVFGRVLMREMEAFMTLAWRLVKL